jgi:hypothetical protein
MYQLLVYISNIGDGLSLHSLVLGILVGACTVESFKHRVDLLNACYSPDGFEKDKYKRLWIFRLKLLYVSYSALVF